MPRRVFIMFCLITSCLVLSLGLAGCREFDPAPAQSKAFVGDVTPPALDDTFRVRIYDADEVYLAGTVNDWDESDPAWELVLQPDGYTWLLACDLPAGLTQYKYVLHKGATTTWLTDPDAVEIISGSGSGDPAYWNAVRGRAYMTPRDLPDPIDRTQLVIYELNVNEFSATETFTGVAAGLTSAAKLVDLGVNAVELLPVTVPSYNGWGYDPVFYAAPNPNFGWPSTFAWMVDQCHMHGIAVILDMVLNHAAGSCPLRQLDDFADSYHFTTTESNPWGMVELDWTDPALREHILESISVWVEKYKVDGFRLDYIGGEPYSTWVWLKNELKARFPELLLIGEDYNYPSSGNSVTNGYDAQWGGNHTDGWGGGGNNFCQVMTTTLTEAGFAWRGSSTIEVGAFGTPYRNMWAVANVVGANDQYAGGVPGDGFSDVIFLESHDENRLVWAVDTYGSSGAQAIGGAQKAYLGAMVQMTSVGIPMLFSGQEIGAEEYRPASPTLYPTNFAGGDQGLRDAYRSLINLRLTEPALQSENTFFQWRDMQQDQIDMTMVYWRGETAVSGDAEIVVALNFDHDDHSWAVPFPSSGTWLRFVPSSGGWINENVAGGVMSETVPASSGILWKRADGISAVR